MITDAQIAEIRARAAAADKGPIVIMRFGDHYSLCSGPYVVACGLHLKDAEFYAAAREDVPALCDRVDELEAENVELQKLYDVLDRDLRDCAEKYSAAADEVDALRAENERLQRVGAETVKVTNDTFRSLHISHSAAASLIECNRQIAALRAKLEEARAENERLMGIAMRTIAGLAEVKTEMEKTPEKLNRIDIMAREVCEERDALRACSNVASERVNELLTDYNREKERADAYCAYAARLEAQLAEIREKAAPIGAMIEKISLLPDSVELTLEYNDTDFIIVEAGQLRALAAAIGKETA